MSRAQATETHPFVAISSFILLLLVSAVSSDISDTASRLFVLLMFGLPLAGLYFWSEAGAERPGFIAVPGFILLYMTVFSAGAKGAGIFLCGILAVVLMAVMRRFYAD